MISIFQDMNKKCSKLDELINYMDSGHLAIFKGLDVKDISDHLKHLLQEFKTTSQLELEVKNSLANKSNSCQ